MVNERLPGLGAIGFDARAFVSFRALNVNS